MPDAKRPTEDRNGRAEALAALSVCESLVLALVEALGLEAEEPVL